MDTDIKYVDTFGFRVFSDDLAKIAVTGYHGPCRILNTISPSSYGVATRDEEFERALKTSDYLVLDGVYFALSSMVLQGRNIKRNQGPDVFYHFMQRLQQEKGRAFFMGSSEDNLRRIKANARRDYPDVEVGYYSPPYRAVFSEEENAEMVAQVNAFAPDVLFVGMTAPKQEKWAVKNRQVLKAGLAVSIGNVFDWYAGTQKAIHPIWFKLRVGWLVRIFLRPEIFRRNTGHQLRFLWHLALTVLRLKRVP